MSGLRLGPEWDIVLFVLGVVAVVLVLVLLEWWVGLAGVVAAICLYALLVYE